MGEMYVFSTLAIYGNDVRVNIGVGFYDSDEGAREESERVSISYYENKGLFNPHPVQTAIMKINPDTLEAIREVYGLSDGLELWREQL